MISRHRTMCITFVILTLTILLAGCGLFETEDDEYMDLTALGEGRLLFASPPPSSPGSNLSLFTITLSSNTVQHFLTANRDFTSPSIMKPPDSYWLIGFGNSRVTVFDAFSRDYHNMDGSGARQRALVLDRTATGRMAYMDGSDSGGYNIVVQASLTAQPVAVTSGASGSISFWTPSWSSDGQWILYARLAGSTGAEAELWRVRPDGSGAEKLPIVTTELPTYAIFSPTGTEVLVPGDFTSYYIDDGRVGRFDHLRELTSMQDQLAAFGYEFVGSPLTGPVHEGDAVTSFRHSFPLSAYWKTGDWIYFDALVASNYGTPPHEVEGVAIFSWFRMSQTLFKHTDPIPLSEERTEGYSISIMRPSIIP